MEGRSWVLAPTSPVWPSPSTERGGGDRWAHAMRPYATVNARPTRAPPFFIGQHCWRFFWRLSSQ